jgi:hypothetical protein
MEGGIKMESAVLSSSTLAMLALEGIKWIVRKIMKNPVYDFPVKFYLVMLPVLNLVAPYGIWLLGLGALPVYQWDTLLQAAAVLVLQSLLSMESVT